MRRRTSILVALAFILVVAGVLAGIGPARTLFAMSRGHSGHTGAHQAPPSSLAATGTPAPWCAPWTISQTPPYATDLSGAAATGPDDVWAVGFSLSDGRPVADHWNGSVWGGTVVANTYYSHFSGVAALAPNNVWAVGGQLVDANDTSHTLIGHFDGSNWSIVPSPNVAGGSNYLNAIAAISPTNIWAVGNTTDSSFHDQTLTLHFDGTAWSIVPSPNDGSGSNDLFGVAAISGSDVWAVGSDHSANTTLAEHWNGTSWSIVPTPMYPTHPVHRGYSQVVGYSAFDGVTARASNDVWAVGQVAGQTTDAALVERWNGTSWSVVPTPYVSGISPLYAIAAVPNSAVLWAVGYEAPSPPSNASYPLIEEWTGSQWVVSPAANSNTTIVQDTLTGVVAPSAGSAWAIGQTGPTDQQALAERHYAPQPAPGLMCP